MNKNTKTVITLIAFALLIAFMPLFLLKNAEFKGSDDVGCKMVEEIIGGEYKPWFTPVLYKMTGGDLPAEMETLFFCLQTGIGVGVIAYCFGYLVARKKYSDKNNCREVTQA
jgi:cobalt/nickel transport protein